MGLGPVLEVGPVTPVAPSPIFRGGLTGQEVWDQLMTSVDAGVGALVTIEKMPQPVSDAPRISVVPKANAERDPLRATRLD
jgi:hypothetical protein